MSAKSATVLPLPIPTSTRPSQWLYARRSAAAVALVALGLAASFLAFSTSHRLTGGRRSTELEPFFSALKTHDDVCVGGVSHSGYIGLRGDSEETPKRSFFWYFEAQNNPDTAPVILTIGGGPGTTGMANPLFGQSHCRITKNATTERNPNAWTDQYNMVALDHPIGAGFSYGTQVNNSRAAAYEAYDFLVKFMSLFPHLAKNKLILASGSYGGVYIPNIATVIHEQNALVLNDLGIPGAKYLNFESMMVSNPISDFLSHNRWMLQQRCMYTDLYNSTMCHTAYESLPFCLESIQNAYMNNTAENRRNAVKACESIDFPTPGRSHENVKYQCDGSIEDCLPELVYATKFMNTPEIKAKLGAKADIEFEFGGDKVYELFRQEGDECQQSYLLYEPLLRAGYRLLHYVGKLDANCAWPGVLSTLKLIHSQYQSVFVESLDVPWDGVDATVRVVGEGAGNMTYVLIGGAGHFVTRDQPEVVRKIVGRWIDNVPFQ